MIQYIPGSCQDKKFHPEHLDSQLECHTVFQKVYIDDPIHTADWGIPEVAVDEMLKWKLEQKYLFL